MTKALEPSNSQGFRAVALVVLSEPTIGLKTGFELSPTSVAIEPIRYTSMFLPP